MSKEHGRERVPPAETEKMINSAIAEAAMAFGLPGGSIKKRNIHIANRPNGAQNPTELFCTTNEAPPQTDEVYRLARVV